MDMAPVRLDEGVSDATPSGIEQTVQFSRRHYRFGYVFIAILCLQMLLGILAVARADERNLMQLTQIMTIEIVLICMFAAVSYFYVRPNQIRLRALRESGR